MSPVLMGLAKSAQRKERIGDLFIVDQWEFAKELRLLMEEATAGFFRSKWLPPVSISTHFSRRTSNSSARHGSAQPTRLRAKPRQPHRMKSTRLEALRAAALQHCQRMENLCE